ncbi:MAG: DUF3048 domain-containing protein [Chloroflexota bacterium]
MQTNIMQTIINTSNNTKSHLTVCRIKQITAIRCILFVSLTICLLIVSGCGRSTPEPTATPTKTPPPPATATFVPTATPLPPPPTNTPVQQEQTQSTEQDQVSPSSLSQAPPEPTRIVSAPNTSPLTGEIVDNPDLLKKRPLVICINNDAAGRAAHYGLGSADVIYEYIVDGFAMTRLSAIYQSRDVERIGPVRSARLPNIWMTDMFDGALACTGGSDPIRYLLRNEASFPYLDADLDDPNNNRYFFSVGNDYRTRMQVSTDGIRKWIREEDIDDSWDLSGFQFSNEPADNYAGTTENIQISYPGGNSVEWQYDANIDGYVRFQGGAQQFDLATNQAILAQNVIVITANHIETDIVEDSLGTKSIDIELFGFGSYRIFRNGFVYEGTWRSDPEGLPRWLGPEEIVAELKPGQSWIQVVRDLNEVRY